jgi:hypothetical protein
MSFYPSGPGAPWGLLHWVLSLLAFIVVIAVIVWAIRAVLVHV